MFKFNNRYSFYIVFESLKGFEIMTRSFDRNIILTMYSYNVVVSVFRSTVVCVSEAGAAERRNPRRRRRDGVRPWSMGPPVLRQLRTEPDTADDGIRSWRRTGCPSGRRSGRVHFRRTCHRVCLVAVCDAY